MTNENNITEEMESAGQQTLELGGMDMQEANIFLMENTGFVGRNKGAVGAAVGTGIASFVGGYFTGKIVEKKKNEALMNAIVTEIDYFDQVNRGVAEGEISETYAFKNANDIKFKILEKINDTKSNEKDKKKWRNLLDMIIDIAVVGRAQQIITERIVVSEVKEDTQ